MIIFHEGLPRAGKTWEAMTQMALPAIKVGRHVCTNIKGVSPEKIAEILEMDIEAVAALLTLVPWDQSVNIHEFAKNDGLVIFDEVQDFHPTGFKLNPEQIEFITQHGQRGIDVVLCGQSYRNIHLFWRDRVQRLIYFKKMTALGAEGRYSWAMNERVSRDKFTEITKGVRKYDPRYFGIYKSHTDGTTNTGNLKDDRAVIWKRPSIRYGVPAFLCAAAVAIWFVAGIFTGKTSIAPSAQIEQAQPQDKAAVPAKEKGVVTEVAESSIKGAETQAIREAVTGTPDDYIASLSLKYRPRLAAFIKAVDGRMAGIIEFRDEGYKVREQIRLSDLHQYGWRFEDKGGYVLLARDEVGSTDTVVVTSWPVEEWGRANAPPVQVLPPAVSADSVVPDTGDRFITIPDTRQKTPNMM